MYCPIFMGLGKNINCLYDISAKFETGLCEIKNVGHIVKLKKTTVFQLYTTKALFAFFL